MGVDEAMHRETALPVDLLGPMCFTSERDGLSFNNDGRVGNAFLPIPHVGIFQ